MKKEEEYVNYKQCLVVCSNDKTMCLYENGQLIRQFDSIVLGKHGCTLDKKEGDGCTPLGTFSLGFAFGLEDVSISYPYYPITSDVYFVSDSESEYYNEWVLLSETQQEFPYDYMKTCSTIQWNEAEHLCDYTIPYQLGLVIEYNMHPKVKGKGSAIFLHVKNKDYTEGCVAICKEEMLFVLNWLHEKDAKIIIR